MSKDFYLIPSEDLERTVLEQHPRLLAKTKHTITALEYELWTTQMIIGKACYLLEQSKDVFADDEVYGLLQAAYRVLTCYEKNWL
jgi:hypothetical protein